MTLYSAHGRLLASRRIAAVLGLLAAAGLLLPCIAHPLAAQTSVAQTPASRVPPDFRTPARSLIDRAIDPTRLVQIAGAVSAEAASAQDLGPRDPSAPLEHMQLILQRPQERQAAFDAAVVALHQHGSSSYHQWLTPQTIGAEFGPSAGDIATLTAYLRSEGFIVNRVANSGTSIDFTGTVAQVQQSFHTQIHNLRLATGEDRYSATVQAQLPDALVPLITGLLPISNISARSLLSPARSPVQPGRSGASGLAHPEDTSGGLYNVGAQDFYTIYNENPLFGSGTTGAGTTVALLEETDINTADVTTFRTMMGISPAAPSLSVMHGAGSATCNDPGITDTGEEGEAVLDTEWAGAAAPGANLLFMSCQTLSTDGIFLSAQAVIDNNLATTMSLSYGATEAGNGSVNTFLSNLWEQAAAQGETVVVASGDAGSANSADQNKPYARHGLEVNSFASTAYNVAAGGTDFQDDYNEKIGGNPYIRSYFWNSSNTATLSSALSYVPETTWNDTCASSLIDYELETSTDPNALCDDTDKGPTYYPTTGGGGGVSTLQPRPTWQTATIFGIPPTSLYNHRLLPDISLFAGNGIWTHLLDFYQSDTGGSQVAGGTSFVSPQLAGIFALIAQQTGERLGQPNFVLYNMAGAEYGTGAYTAGNTCNGSGSTGVAVTSTLPAATCIFYDIETGNNSQACSKGSRNCFTESGSFGILSTSNSAAVPGYPATQGYDMATGIGSLNIANLVNNWQNAAAGGVTYTPTVSVTGSAASSIYGSFPAITYTAAVSGPGSFPTGSVAFSGSGAVATIGTGTLTESSGCSTGGACTESATQAYTPSPTLAPGVYTISGSYLSTNENYATASGSTTLTVNAQTPTVSVAAITVPYGTAAVSFSATISFTGSGLAPAGGLTFRVDSGSPVTATCTGSSSPLTCIYNGYNIAALAAGTHTITATSLADANYTLATGTNSLLLTTPPTITFTVPAHHTLDLPFTVAASSNSAGALTYSVVSGPATVIGSTVTLTGAPGTVVLQALQAANGTYASGTQTASFLVIDGSVWLGNSTSSLSAFDLTGLAITGAGGFSGAGVGTIASPLGMAFDASGNMWVASSNGIGKFTRQGVAVSSTPYTGGGVSNPLAVAVDGAGKVWVANTNGTVSVLTNSGAAVSPSAGYTGPSDTPAGIAIDISGSVWVPGSTANTVTRILGAATPVVPLATGAATGPGGTP